MSGETSVPVSAPKPKLDTWAIIQKAAARAGQGGIAGAAAMAVNVGSLMWIRTVVNYQYRYGTSMSTAFKTLYADGGIPRYQYIIQDVWKLFSVLLHDLDETDFTEAYFLPLSRDPYPDLVILLPILGLLPFWTHSSKQKIFPPLSKPLRRQLVLHFFALS